MNEFELIDSVLATLGEATLSDAVALGPGDDCAAVRPPPGEVLVSSIDCLVAGVHFPARAPAEQVGYRALMVSLSDLAAMGAAPSHALVSVSVDDDGAAWLTGLARGLRAAAAQTGVAVVGGNLSRGAAAVHVSVHGFAPEDALLRRDRAAVGDKLYVTGALGGAAAALARGGLDAGADLDALAERYFRPQARLDAGLRLRGHAACAIDISDGLLQDAEHLAAASGVQVQIVSAQLPIFPGASLEQALAGGDDYELLFAAAVPPPELGVAVTEIGFIAEGERVLVDGQPVTPRGYQHFS